MYGWYYPELNCVLIIVNIILFTKLVFNQGPIEDQLSVNGLPCIIIRNKSP